MEKPKFKSALDMPDVPKVMPAHLKQNRTRVKCGKNAPDQTSSTQYSGAYRSMDEDNSFSFKDFKKNLKIDVKRLDEEVMEFDLIGVDASIANTLRRILIAEVPTMAIEKVFIVNNTSIIQDEVLSHRLGLVPIKADHNDFVERDWTMEKASEKDTIVFSLDVKCYREGNKIVNESVYSSQLKWLPKGSQLPPEEGAVKFTTFSCDQSTTVAGGSVAPVNDDIILAKLRPGQAIHLEAHAVKGIGKEHAKWSPVATAFYRLLPEVVIKRPLSEAEAKHLHKVCPKDVFDIEDSVLTVARPRDCTICRECLRHPQKDGEDLVELQRVRDHFLFTIESTGQAPPEALFKEALKILKTKSSKTKSYV